MNEPDKQAFLAVYDEHADGVYRRCLFKTSDKELAQDLTQQAFTKTWNYLQEGKNIRHMKGFVFKTANNLIKDHYKKKKSISMGDIEEFDPADITDEIENITAKSEVNEVLRAMGDLKEADRDVLMLNVVEGHGPKSIADLKDERENTVAVRIHRAKKRLREVLGKKTDDEQQG